MVMETEYLTVTQAANYLSVSRRTIYNWLISKKLEYKLTPGGMRRILKTDLIKDEVPFDRTWKANE